MASWKTPVKIPILGSSSLYVVVSPERSTQAANQLATVLGNHEFGEESVASGNFLAYYCLDGWFGAL